jgi:hypothetical protein
MSCHAITNKNKNCRNKAIKTKTYCYRHAEQYKLEKPDSCSICTESLSTENKPQKCGHYFHDDCIQMWFNQNPLGKCPICRKILKKSKDIEIIDLSQLELTPETIIMISQVMSEVIGLPQSLCLEMIQLEIQRMS